MGFSGLDNVQNGLYSDDPSDRCLNAAAANILNVMKFRSSAFRVENSSQGSGGINPELSPSKSPQTGMTSYYESQCVLLLGDK